MNFYPKEHHLSLANISNVIININEINKTSNYKLLLEKLCEIAKCSALRVVFHHKFEAANTNKRSFKQYIHTSNQNIDFNKIKTPAIKFAEQNVFIGEKIKENSFYMLATNAVKQLKDVYQTLCVPVHNAHQHCCVVLKQYHHDSLFWFVRDKSGPKFNQNDINMLHLILPHVSLLLQRFENQTIDHDVIELYRHVLDQSDKGILVCSENTAIMLANQHIISYLSGSNIFDTKNDKLTCSNDIWNKQLIQYIKVCCQNKAGTVKQSIEMQEQDVTILITISALECTDCKDFNLCLVVFDFQYSLNWALVAQEYELTLKEQQLIKALYHQHKLPELEEKLNVSYNTLRTHMQNILKKMNVHSQAQMMSKLNMFKGL
jgi:DNA-binding CsgD family transcriptional regulator